MSSDVVKSQTFAPGGKQRSGPFLVIFSDHALVAQTMTDVVAIISALNDTAYKTRTVPVCIVINIGNALNKILRRIYKNNYICQQSGRYSISQLCGATGSNGATVRAWFNTYKLDMDARGRAGKYRYTIADMLKTAIIHYLCANYGCAGPAIIERLNMVSEQLCEFCHSRTQAANSAS
jgi:hypothetical protein